MSFGKMNTFIDIISTAPSKDDEGFVTEGDTILASVRAYKEDRHGNERWANMAAFSTASAMFQFRKIPGVEISTSLFIFCADGRYRVLSVENVRGRGMYLEVLAEKLEPSVR
ncbi:head-tail adaptor protein [Caproicibacterium amylolyticum]|uniref:Head-tail adaptor protein n=1 Tax=Caproicibacterium amylolyticum TaxID=2766537 RepID=A0A7G9WGS0_9FIRM|nr:head-tail adaptor protein [Caproicibacterium amylolyticum]QNO17882.1 head-tail adaptor protein [Caproicibacterium amylolyticum]